MNIVSLQVGAPAPLSNAASERAPWFESATHEPIVLAFLRDWLPAEIGPRALGQLRAELRGLGALLTIVARDRIWTFRADDDFEQRAVALESGQVARIHSAYGVDPHCATGFALFVIDAKRTLRFTHVDMQSDPIAGSTMLLSCLSEAGRRLTTASSRLTMSRLTMSRRDLLVLSLVSSFASLFNVACGDSKSSGDSDGPPPPVDDASAGPIDVTLNVNGTEHQLRIDARVSLLDALRERLGLTGSKKGCDHGQCGACTVLVDDRRVNACLTLAVMVEGTQITTIEGLAQGDTLHPMQAAFIAEDGFQCGYCTPGQIMSAVALLKENRAQSDDEVREAMSGNICRCGAHCNIIAAIQRARRELV